MNCIICKNYGDCPVEKEVEGRTWKLSSNGLNGIECDEYMPNYITPEQWEKRTGRARPDDGAVYCRGDNKNGIWRKWIVLNYKDAKEGARIALDRGRNSQIVCATEAGPPPDGWSPND